MSLSALFSFSSWLTVILLTICASTFLHGKWGFGPYQFGDPQTKGFQGIFWKAARVGERLSPWVSAGCMLMAIHAIFLGR